MNERLNVAVLDPDACLAQLDKAKGPVELTLVPSASAEDLLRAVTVDEPDVVLLDFEMPGISGLELTRRLRAANPGVPILLLSANPDWSILETDPLIEIVLIQEKCYNEYQD
jgi:CheY-like chemotaxis protein